ncbi:MAG: hypothetical protein ACXWAT_13205 [Methylobacter sp.]
MIMPNHFMIFLRFSCFTWNKYVKCLGYQSKHLTALTVKSFMLSIAISAVTQFTGCNVTVRAGNKPDLAVLEKTLKSGVSTEQDVLKELGAPVGKGREMLPFMDKPRTTWTYYYEEGDLNDDRRLFLFVFFDKERYDGYMWFSSLPEFKPKSGS